MASPTPAAAPFSIRILIDWRRPYPAIDASGDAGADGASQGVLRAGIVEDRRWQPVVRSAKGPGAVVTMSTHMVILGKGRNNKACSDDRHSAECFDVHGVPP